MMTLEVLKGRKYIWFVGLFLLSLAVRLIFLDYSIVRIIEADGAGYVASAKGFLNGFDIRNIAIINPPLFPMLIAFFSWISSDWEMAGRMVSIVSGSFIAPLVFLISSAKGNSLKVSVFSGLFLVVSPTFVTTSFQVFNDSMNSALLLTGVWQLVVASRNGKGKNFFYSGLGFALAYLTRPDSIVPSFFAFLTTAYFSVLRSDLKKKGFLLFLAFTAGFSVLSVPYLFYLHGQVGKWVVAGRQIVAQSDAAAVAFGNYEDANYGLLPDLTLKGDYLNRVKGGETSIKKGLISMWMEDPKKMMIPLLGNLKVEWDVFINAVPWYIKVLALAAIVLQLRSFVPNNLHLFVYSTPLLFLYPFFWADPRHIYHFLLPLWMWAAEGIESLSSILKKIRLRERILRTSVIEYLLYTALIIVFLLSFTPKEVGPKELSYLRQKNTGVWISKNTPKDAVIMARWGRLTFYTDRETVMFPFGEWELIKKYMKKQGVTHLVVDDSFYNIRPQVAHLLSPIISGSSMSPDDSLSISYIKRDSFGGMVVYEVKKE